MAKLPKSFNEKEHGDMGFDPLPKDDYVVKIVDSDYKENSKKTGHMIVLKREVVSGKYKGRIIFSNLNVDNPSAQTREIAGKEFAATCRACGKVAVEDTAELHGILHVISLVVQKGSGDNADQNKIIKIKPLDGKASVPGAPSKIEVDDEDSEPASSKPSRMKAVFEDDEEEEIIEEEPIVDDDDERFNETKNQAEHPMFDDDD